MKILPLPLIYLIIGQKKILFFSLDFLIRNSNNNNKKKKYITLTFRIIIK